MGSSLDVWRAGWKPKNSAAAVTVPSPLATDSPETRISQPVNRQIVQVTVRPSKTPSTPLAVVRMTDSMRNWL